jgi:hypothetical protein
LLPKQVLRTRLSRAKPPSNPGCRFGHIRDLRCAVVMHHDEADVSAFYSNPLHPHPAAPQPPSPLGRRGAAPAFA